MAVLTDTERARTAAQWMRENTGTVSCLKADVRTAVNVLDDYFDGMVAARPSSSLASALNNNAAAFMAGTNAAQQKDLGGYVMMRRIGKLRAQED